MSQLLTDVDGTIFTLWLPVRALLLCLWTGCDCGIITYPCDPWFLVMFRYGENAEAFVFISWDF